MKPILFIFPFLVLINSAATAQTAPTPIKPSISIDAELPPSMQAGNLNYVLSLSDNDFKSQKYVFYTDSNATVAYISINGSKVRMTGGPNAEHIMAYVGNGYTVTLSRDKNVLPSSANDQSNLKIQGTIVIYTKDGQVVVKKVAGNQITAAKK